MILEGSFMNSSSISRFKTLDLIQSSPYFKCSFIKKDNSLRKMTCSFEENKNDSNSLLVVWDIEKDGFRYINLDTLQDITIKDTFYKVV